MAHPFANAFNCRKAKVQRIESSEYGVQFVWLSPCLCPAFMDTLHQSGDGTVRRVTGCGLAFQPWLSGVQSVAARDTVEQVGALRRDVQEGVQKGFEAMAGAVQGGLQSLLERGILAAGSPPALPAASPETDEEPS